MENNPYEAPKHSGRPPSAPGHWRRRWRRICLPSLGAFVFFMLTLPSLDKILPRNDGRFWVVIGKAILALIALGSGLLAGIAGIGWVISRRPTGEGFLPTPAPEQGRLG